MKRCNSGSNRIKINTDEPIPYNKNILKNNEINSGKIPIKKKINNYRGKSFSRRGESTSCDSNEQVNNNKDSNKKTEENSSDKNKKIIPGKFNINHYIIKKQIGQGTFGQIFLVEDKNNHNKYALKKIIAGSSNDINNIQKEYQILLDIQNNVQDINVVNIFGLSKYKLDITTYVLYVLMELASTDWEKEILSRKATRKYYSEKELIKILSSLIKSLSILEKQNISHRDIKPQNVLVFYDKYLNKIYKLADFGEAKELLKDEKPTNKQTLRGTELYMSPILFFALRGRKVMKYIKHNPYKSDVFSFGLCALFAATLCFESLYDVRELKSNVSLRVVVEKYLRFRYSQDIISIITKMLDVNETTRMDFIELEKEFNKFQI
jgi:serine/threonine protein kinase